ncbi:ATP-grasp domain-containing protein [Streptomyces coeruleorubidus]|uniref:ATP-grasp domain-containing protein n=1 Tax=Streptomyces coeruleorubidus TaxID=116188 RepID=UPI0033C9740B
MRLTLEPRAPHAAPGPLPRLREAVVLVDGVLNGAPFKEACREAGLPVIGVYTFDRQTLEAMSPQHADGDAVSLYGDDPHRITARLKELTDTVAAVVPATEPGVCCAAEVAAHWGLPANPVPTAAACRDKRLMRDLARRTGIRVPAHEVVREAADLRAAARRIGFPLIVKPATGAASHNVVLVDAERKLAGALAEDRRDLFGSVVDEWLVEEYVQGTEYAVNTFTVDGRHTVVDTWQYRLPGTDDYDNPYWDFVQVDRATRARAEVERFALDVLDAFGVRIGPCHVEIKLDASGPVLIEIGARLPGAGIPLQWQRHSDWRPYHDTLACYLGRRPMLADRRPRFDATVGMCFIRNDGPPGVLRCLEGIDQVAGYAGVEEILAPFRPGDSVPRTRDLGTELAKVRLSAPTGQALESLIASVRRTVRAEIVPDPTG